MNFYDKMAIVCRHIPKGTVAVPTGRSPFSARSRKTPGRWATVSGKIWRGIRFRPTASSTPRGTEAARDILKPGICRSAFSRRRAWRWCARKGLKVDLKRFGWKNTLDDAMMIEAEFRKQEAKEDAESWNAG